MLRKLGKWNFATGCSEQIGTLSISEDGVDFNLILESDKELSLPLMDDFIYGKTMDNELYTLFKCSICHEDTYDFDKGGATYKYTITAEYLLKGETFTDNSEFKINELFFEFTELDIWTYQEILQVSKDNKGGIQVKVAQIPPIPYDFKEFKLNVQYKNNIKNYNFQERNKLELSTICFFKLEFNKPLSFFEVINTIGKIKEFISLFMLQPISISKLNAVSNKDFQIYNKFINPVYKNLLTRNQKEFYISFDEIKDNFQFYLESWIEKYDILKPVINLYFGTLQQTTSYEVHFLNLVQALEAYHRRTKNNRIWSKEEFKERKDLILENIPPEYKEWVRGKINYGYEPTLHTRLEELLSPHTELFRDIYNDKASLIKAIKQTRNYNTHFDKDLENKTLRGHDLEVLVNFLKSMIEFYLLQEIGVNEELLLHKTKNKIDNIYNMQSQFSTLN